MNQVWFTKVHQSCLLLMSVQKRVRAQNLPVEGEFNLQEQWFTVETSFHLISFIQRITLFSKICIRNKTRKLPNKYLGMKTAMTLVRSFTINNKKTPWGIWESFLRNQFNIYYAITELCFFSSLFKLEVFPTQVLLTIW